MTAQNKEPRTVGAVPRLKGNDNRPKIRNSQAKPKQREYPDGWSRWIEPYQPSEAREFLGDWGNSIVELGDDPDTNQQHEELHQEAIAWQRAMHAYAHWRAA